MKYIFVWLIQLFPELFKILAKCEQHGHCETVGHQPGEERNARGGEKCT